jgi:hypothetical protein
MQKLKCPECGLTVSVRTEGSGRRREPCPRCLARSGGLVSVWLTRGPSKRPRPLSLEQRVRGMLRGGSLARG